MEKKSLEKKCTLCKSKKAIKQFKKGYICSECINATKKELTKL